MKTFFPILGLALLGAATALFAADPAASESYQIRNRQFGNLLRPKDANGATGTPIVLYSAQPWKCMTWKLQTAGEGAFCLQNHFTSKTFAAEAGRNPAVVTQVPITKDSTNNPAWKFTKLSDGAIEITDSKSGQALTAVKEGGSSRIELQPWAGKDSQKWDLEKIDPKDLTM